MNNEIKALKSDLALLKFQLGDRVNQVEERLNTLEKKFQHSQQSNDEVDTTITAVVQQTDVTNTQYNAAEVIDNVSISSSHVNQEKQPATVDQAKRVDALVLDLFLPKIVQALLSMMFEWLAPVINLYKSYKEKGMLGIFILTIVGIALVLAGFGYLMQLLIDQLGAGSKSLLMCFAALLVMGTGIGLKIKTGFGEFATAIVTLGILLSYCTVYFSGSVYGILPSSVVLILYLAVALLCHGVAALLETKIVSSLGIIGIATMPILSNYMSDAVQIEPLYYLLSLSFIAISSLIFSYKNNDKWLANLTLTFTLISVEWVIGVENMAVSAWTVNMFYLIFFVYGALMLFTHKEDNHEDNSDESNSHAQRNQNTPPIALITSYKNSLLFIAALVGSIVFMFFQASELFSTQMSASFAFNGVLATATAVLFYKVKHEVTPFIILLVALWGVLAIISAISHTYWGVSWAIEGLLLLYIGRKYALEFVSNQGQGLTAVALVYSLVAIVPYFPLPALLSIDGWMLSIAVILIIATWQRMITTKGFDLFSQNRIKPLLKLIEVIWISVLIVGCSSMLLGHFTGAVAIVLQVFVLFRARYCKQTSIEIFAILLIFIPIFYIAHGMLLVESYRFTMLPLFAKLAVVSVFSQLWLWAAFYRKYHPNSALKASAEAVRIFFYVLLPICWVGSVIRKLDENALLLLWLSPALALFFAQKIKHHVLIKEAKVLTLLASVLFMALIGQLTLLNSSLAFIGFTALYGTSYLLNKKTANPLYEFICTLGLISIGFALPNIVFFQTESVLFALLVGIIYWGSCLALIDRSAHLQRNQIYVFIVNCLLVVFAWVLIQQDPLYAVIPIVFLCVMRWKLSYFSRQSFITVLTKNNSHLLLHTVGIITYLSFFSALYQYHLDLLIAPTLAIHGAAILFLKNRHITTIRYSFSLILLGIVKLAMIDAASALLWQKVVLFMGIGVFILIASFWYQKLVSKMNLSDATDENDSKNTDIENVFSE